jgi:sulfide:quinone oxidoreductase
MSTTTLILGAGFGGLAAARTLRARLPREHRIVLVDRARDFHVGAGQTWVMLGERAPEDVGRPRAALVPAGVERIEAEIARLDPAMRSIETSAGSFTGDHLVIALGAEMDLGAVPGLAAAAHSFFTMDGALRLRDALAAFRGGDLLLLIPRTPFKCPPAPYEAALLLHAHFVARGMRERVNLAVWSVEGSPMGTAGPDVGAMVRAELERRGIAYHPKQRAARVDEAARRVEFDGGASARYDLLVAIPPHRAPLVVADAGLLAESGWIPADPRTLEVKRERVASHTYAVGDVSSVPLPGRWSPDVPLVLPKAGIFAAQHGEVVAGRIAAAILGGESPVFAGAGFCFIETGDGEALRGDGEFFRTPSPVMRFAAPDAAQREQKLAWVRDTLAPIA